jgi:hypothetical protein
VVAVVANPQPVRDEAVSGAAKPVHVWVRVGRDDAPTVIDLLSALHVRESLLTVRVPASVVIA